MSKAGSLAKHRALSLPRGPRSNVGRGSESDRCGVLAFVAPDSGLPGRMKSSCTPNWYAHASIARLQNSVPLSTTAHGSILVSRPRFSGAMPIGRIAGPEAMKFDGWQRLNAEYAKQFDIEARREGAGGKGA
jgi:hypothetical protein